MNFARGRGQLPPDTVFIEPFARNRFPDLRELFRQRALLFFLVRKDVTMRYKQTVLGVVWVVLRPLSMMLLLTFVFGTIFERETSDDLPFAIFVFSALVPWTYFSSAVTECVRSVSGERELIKRVYFPRLILPLVPVLAHLVDFTVSFGILFVLMAAYGVAPGPAILALPAFFLMLLAFAIGSGAWLAALNVRYRDIPYAIPFLIQLGFFMSPIIYPVDQLDKGWRGLYHLNPMVGVIEGFRWSVTGGEAPAFVALLFSAVVAVAVLVTGLWHFGSREGDFVRDA